MHIEIVMPGGPKKMNKSLRYNSGCLPVIIRLCLTHSMLCDCYIKEKKVAIVVYLKMIPQRDNSVKVSALLRAGHKVSEVANLVGFLAQPYMRSGSVWTMAMISTDM